MRITNHSYNGTETVIFDSIRHQYTWNDKVIPGSTTVLSILNKPALMYWSANCAADYWKDNVKPGVALDELQIDAIYTRSKKAHTQKKTDSATLGSFVHHFVEQYIRGENPELPINPEMRGSCERFLNWVKEHNVKFLLSEQLVFSKSKLFAGTTDFICEIDAKLWIGDLKTSSGVWDEMLMQVSSYLNARHEEFNSEMYSGAIIVRVGKTDGDFETVSKTTEELKPYYDVFLNCLSTYNSLKLIEKK